MVAAGVDPTGEGEALPDLLGARLAAAEVAPAHAVASARSVSASTTTTFFAPSRPACVCWPLTERPAKSASARTPARAQLHHLRQHGGAVGSVRADEEDVDPLVLRQRRACVLERDQEALDARAEADAGGVRPTQLLGEAVVAAAAGEGRLRSALGAEELPGRARVVVEPAYERRHELVPDAERVEVATHLREVLAARFAERVADRRRLAQDLLHGRRLRGDVVERAQRITRRLLACAVVEVAGVLLEPGPQAFEVRGPALGVADRVELETVLVDPEPTEERVVQLDHLGVAGRVVRADRLDVELPVLAKAALLRSAVAVDRLERVELLRLRLAV